MRIAILGLGYVGTTTAACLVRDGHELVGIDVNPEKVAAIGAGRSPVVEPGVEALLREGVASGRLRSTTLLAPEIGTIDLVIVCVGTPSRVDGKLDLAHLLEVTRQLGRAVRERPDAAAPLLIVIRSTIPPGTMDKLVLPTLATAAGEGPGRRYEVAFNPEFLRESTAVKDYFAPPKIVLGERAPGLTRRLRGIYGGLDAPWFEVPFATAEMVKFIDNSWHALKVAFANEVGRLCIARGLDPQGVADIFLADTKLNISPSYLRPGGPYGGSCLPKDLGAVLALARDAGLVLPVLAGARESNGLHLAWLLQRIQAAAPPPGPVLLLGLSFKTGTDDLRNSPLLDLAQLLLEAGYDLQVHDPDLDPTRLLGANFALAVEHQELLASRMTTDVAAAAASARLVIRGKPLPAAEACLPPGTPLFDISRLGAAV